MELNTVLTCDELEAILASFYWLMTVLVLEVHDLDLDIGGMVLCGGWGVVNTALPTQESTGSSSYSGE